VIDSILAAGVDRDRPIAAPRYAENGARNPVLLHRSAFHLVMELTGDRGLGPVLGAHPELVRDVPVAGANPDIDTRADLVRLLEEAWAARVRENREQVERHREVPDGSDFYAPVTSLFRADPARTDDAVLDALLRLVAPGETWLDIGAGAGRFALPIARRLAASGGSVVAVEPSGGMRGALLELARDHGISNVRVVDGRWPDAAAMVPPADVALIAHVGYDIERIGPFVAAMESSVSRLCVAVLMERQPSSVADPCWPLVWGESRVALPALPAFLEFLKARGSAPATERVEGAPRGFDTRDELAGFLRRQLWVAEGSAADARFRAALEDLIVRRDDGRYGVRDQHPAVIGIVTWRAGVA
jgi:SAM-dependent methyltransferase